MLVLLIGLVLVSVVAAIVGGVLGSKKISDPKPDSQNENPTPVTVTQTVHIVAGSTIPPIVAGATVTSSAAPSDAPTNDEPWLTGQEDSIYNVKGFGGNLLVDNLKKPNWLIRKVPAADQEIYNTYYPWEEAKLRQAYNIQAENASGTIYQIGRAHV